MKLYTDCNIRYRIPVIFKHKYNEYMQRSHRVTKTHPLTPAIGCALLLLLNY